MTTKLRITKEREYQAGVIDDDKVINRQIKLEQDDTANDHFLKTPSLANNHCDKSFTPPEFYDPMTTSGNGAVIEYQATPDSCPGAHVQGITEYEKQVGPSRFFQPPREYQDLLSNPYQMNAAPMSQEMEQHKVNDVLFQGYNTTVDYILQEAIEGNFAALEQLHNYDGALYTSIMSFAYNSFEKAMSAGQNHGRYPSDQFYCNSLSPLSFNVTTPDPFDTSSYYPSQQMTQSETMQEAVISNVSDKTLAKQYYMQHSFGSAREHVLRQSVVSPNEPRVYLNQFESPEGSNGPGLCDLSSSKYKMNAERYFNDDTKQHLKEWVLAHLDYPYPTKQEKMEMCQKTGLNARQLENWFTNTRKRGWKQYAIERGILPSKLAPVKVRKIRSTGRPRGRPRKTSPAEGALTTKIIKIVDNCSEKKKAVSIKKMLQCK